MHPDKKVGLALGILLIGITGAFFFRNDAPSPNEETLTLSDPESLDRKVSQKPGAPYFPEDESPETDEQLDLTDVPETSAADVIPDVPQVGSTGYRGIFAAPIDDGDVQGSVERFADRRAPLPGRDLDSLDGESVGLNSGSRGETSLNDAGQRESTPDGSRSGFITHKVVEGDNLSKLASKYLGSHSKYLTLYEANRDLLASPDDLAPGMQLKIPQSQGEAATPSKRSAGGASTSTKTSSSGRVAKSRNKASFEQPDRNSVIALGGARRTERGMSQTPPPNLPRVEGLNPGANPAVIASRPK
jgi:hypothetical protein